MRKRNTVIIVLLTILAASYAGNTDAQFWKKKSKRKHKHEQTSDAKSDSTAATTALTKEQKKEKKKKEKEERKRQKLALKHKGKQDSKNATAKKTLPKTTAPVLKKRAEIVYAPTQIKPRYRIDVIAPLYLDDLVKGQYVTYNDKIPEKAVPGVSFIEGVNIAADSLKKAGFNVDIYLHDASSFQESAEILTTKNKLDSTDLIIGAVQSHDVPILAAYAKKKHVYFISALSASDGGVKENQYFTLIQPSLKSHCEWMVKDIAKTFPGQKVALLYRTSPALEESAYSYITGDTADKVSFKALLCNSLPTREKLLYVFDTTRPNVVLVPILDVNYADSILKVLVRDFPEAHFEVYGLPSWNGLTDLHKAKAFPNLSINITDPFYFNPASPSGIYIERSFKKDYSGKPSELVYRGYETLFWYANLLKQYGTIFKYTDNAPAPFTPFEISPQWDKNNGLLYNENRHIFLTRYEGGASKTE